MFLYEYENLRQQMNMQFIIVDYLLVTISISTNQVIVNFIHVLSSCVHNKEWNYLSRFENFPWM